MHIPDGYLSPSTCAALYAAAAPFWYVALRRIERVITTRTVPLLAVFAAFCFVIMMFNLPLPGGTTGHAVGMGMAAIILGPWVSILAVSMALLIQALFFGDGGLTAFGANCFNMAIAGSLVAYGCYRLLARGAALTAPRRVLAAGLAGYAAINVAALCAALEFGLQPLLFHDASGTPLYAPYPLRVAIPAMMLGHLTFAGLAEFVLTAGMVRYLQRAEPELLRATALDAPALEPAGSPLPSASWPAARKLWIALGLIALLTPLGILAVGSAWGEWRAEDFSNAQARQQIAAASANQPPPAHAPTGLARWSAFWKAPLSAYAPPFIRSASFGYLVSALLGIGLVVVLAWLLGAFLIRRAPPRRAKGFVERTTAGLLRAADEALFAEKIARSNGLLQRLDARSKLAGLGALIAAAVAVHSFGSLLALFAVAILLALLSRVSLAVLARRVWLAVFVFTGAIALPALFLVPGATLYRLPGLDWPVSAQGLYSAALLLLRAETAATFSLLLVLSTPWNRLLRALRFFRIPAVFVVLLEMTYRYLFLLLQVAHNMFESRETRLLARFQPAEQRRLAAAAAAVLLDKSLALSSDVHTAMRARGFRGEVYLLDDLRMRASDWIQSSVLVSIAALAFYLGR
jgi:cobalt/nickel transport system permease protein